MSAKGKTLYVLAALISIALTASGVYFYYGFTHRSVQELPVAVREVVSLGAGSCFIPRKALTERTSTSEGFVFQLKDLRARKERVGLLEELENGFRVKSGSLRPGDYILVNPQGVSDHQAVTPVSGMADRQWIEMILKSGIAAIEEENFHESLRFVSPRYHDTWGYTEKLIEAFLNRAFKEFSNPRLEIAGRPVIQVSGNRARVQTAVRLRATFQSRSNYLLGDAGGFNSLSLTLEKDTSGWKLVDVKGLKPLGFDEGFMRLIGFEIGLPLTESEKRERQKACMPCRERMAERFGN